VTLCTRGRTAPIGGRGLAGVTAVAVPVWARFDSLRNVAVRDVPDRLLARLSVKVPLVISAAFMLTALGFGIKHRSMMGRGWVDIPYHSIVERG